MNTINHYSQLNSAKLISGGHEYFGLLKKMISNAQNTLHIQTYIFSDDYTGTMIAEQLIIAAKRNVSVFIIADGVASKSLNHNFISSLENAGVHFRFFEPLFKNKKYYLGRRLHHKIITADNRYALVRGINIADRYNDMPKEKAWLDYAILVEGEIVSQINEYCRSVWDGFSYTDFPEKETVYNFADLIPLNNRCEIRMRRNDWMWHKNEISSSYIEMLHQSKKEVIIPGPSDVWIVKKAERWLYDWLLRNKIELYEYQNNVLHGKLAVCDKEWITIGSYNINNLSTYASIEFNLDVKNNILAESVYGTMENVIKQDCLPVTKETHKKSKNPFKQLTRWISYQLIRAALKMFTFYFKQKHQ
ncbi:MAG: phospholipase D-like domain-containing protein [Pseudomonadota bacterium]